VVALDQLVAGPLEARAVLGAVEMVVRFRLEEMVKLI
jgi:hypothetical protein